MEAVASLPCRTFWSSDVASDWIRAVSTRHRKLSQAEIRSAFSSESGRPVPPILSLSLVSQLTGVTCKTLYQWIAQGRLDGSFRKRGKRHLFWRDRLVEILFNGSEWQ